ncbi:hypothetical protein H0G86_009832 [Trichoderma simmonsii]|uniref:Uncharacterized protein n=1 Tax=Trichoderma simmonsii TaxID=1491479 RepID=A0A8G0LIB4_9HYPO|nr:hypothetical protein H0G86_009832 [Trichoderma simmonsii]
MEPSRMVQHMASYTSYEGSSSGMCLPHKEHTARGMPCCTLNVHNVLHMAPCKTDTQHRHGKSQSSCVGMSYSFDHTSGYRCRDSAS